MQDLERLIYMNEDLLPLPPSLANSVMINEDPDIVTIDKPVHFTKGSPLDELKTELLASGQFDANNHDTPLAPSENSETEFEENSSESIRPSTCNYQFKPTTAEELLEFSNEQHYDSATDTDTTDGSLQRLCSVFPVKPSYNTWSKGDNDQEIQHEIGDDLGHLNTVIPLVPRYKSNRMSVLSMASSIAAIAPFIQAQAGDDIDTPSGYYTPFDVQPSQYTFSSPNANPNTKSISGEVNSIERLNILMQRAVINAQKRQIHGIAEQTIEEWSTSLDSCFDGNYDVYSSLEIPNAPLLKQNIDTSDKLNLNSVTSRTRRAVESWHRMSRNWFGTSDHSYQQCHDNSSFITALESVNENDTLSAVPSLSEAESSVDTSNTGASIKTRRSFFWGHKTPTQNNIKPKNKSHKISRFFKSFLSPTSA